MAASCAIILSDSHGKFACFHFTHAGEYFGTGSGLSFHLFTYAGSFRIGNRIIGSRFMTVSIYKKNQSMSSGSGGTRTRILQSVFLKAIF